MSYILAGLATGLGQGLVRQGEAKAAEAESERERGFKTALENLRAGNDRMNAEVAADLQDANTQREYDYKDKMAANQLPRDIARDRAEGAIRIGVDNNAAKNDVSLAKVRADLDRRNDKASLELKQEIDNGTIKQFVIDQDGNYVGLTANGGARRTTAKANASDTELRGGGLGGGSGLFPELEGQPAAAPRAPAPAAKPAPAPAKAAPKTMTRADIKQTASDTGLTEAMAKRLLENNGYVLKE